MKINTMFLSCLMFASCGSQTFEHSKLANGSSQPCLDRFEGVEYAMLPQQSANLDSLGFVTVSDDEIPLFKVKTTWVTNENGVLFITNPVNVVNFEILNMDGSIPSEVTVDHVYPVMDMGGMAHSTNTCHVTEIETKVTGNMIQVSNINFIMGARMPNRWFLYKLNFMVDGQSGSIDRLNIPHKVQ